RIAGETLPAFGYTPAQIDEIQAIILATQMPQSPTTFLQQLMCDADLDSIGRDDYLDTSYHLRDELAAHGTYVPLETWYQRQAHFLKTHEFFTEVARTLRDRKKRENIALLERLLAEQR
ncbi:MAG: phosphohydrolase, partial [Anaerolineae bacterium]|nr:phosphohydrolase [Anaerolineae bacterium]